MAVHTITIPDRVRDGELCAIVWDDGAVYGEHSLFPDLRRIFDALKPVTMGGPGGIWDLNDPAHVPLEFRTCLGLYWPVLDEPLRYALPTEFEGVEVPWPDPGTIEELWTIDENSGWIVHSRTNELVDPAIL